MVSSRTSKGEVSMWYIPTIIFAIAFLIMLFLKSRDRRNFEKVKTELSEKKSQFSKELTNLKIKHSEEIRAIIADNASKIEKLQARHKNEMRNLREMNASLQKGFDMYKEQYRRALLLYPNLDIEIDKMIKEEMVKADISKANEFDEFASRFVSRSASRYITEELEQLFIRYDSLTDEQKHYVMADIEKLSDLLNASLKLQQEYLQRQQCGTE